MVMKRLILRYLFDIKVSKITRGHNFTLVKKQSRLDVRKFSFSQRTINVRNKLSTECIYVVLPLVSLCRGEADLLVTAK